MKVKYPKKFSISRNKVIIDHCKGKKILHVGACDAPYTKEKYDGTYGPLLYSEIDKVCLEQLGIDLDLNSINFLNNKAEEFPNSKIQFFDMNKLEDLNYQPDIIIFGEVIEHLMNLEIALSNLKQIMTKDTLIIISTPNAYYVNHFINALLGFEHMHEDHKVYFSYGYLKNLLKFNGLIVEIGYFTFLDRGEDTNMNIFGKISYYTSKIFSRLFKGVSETLLIIAKQK